jgi:hypothetical protein
MPWIVPAEASGAVSRTDRTTAKGKNDFFPNMIFPHLGGKGVFWIAGNSSTGTDRF